MSFRDAVFGVAGGVYLDEEEESYDADGEKHRREFFDTSERHRFFTRPRRAYKPARLVEPSRESEAYLCDVASVTRGARS